MPLARQVLPHIPPNSFNGAPAKLICLVSRPYDLRPVIQVPQARLFIETSLPAYYLLANMPKHSW